MFIFSGTFYRFLGPYLNRLLIKNTRQAIEEYKVPELKEIKNKFNRSFDFSPQNYFEEAIKNNSIFLGVDSKKQPILINRKKWCSVHAAIQGETGSGKGVSASLQLAQSLMYGDLCVIFAPKEDEWAPHVYKDICDKEKLPFQLVDCRQGTPAQINPLKGINEHELYELLISSFDLSRQGGDADHHRNNDRKAAKIISKLGRNTSDINLSNLFNLSHGMLGDFSKKCEGLLTQLEEVADLSAVQTNQGVDLEGFMETGGCLIIQGSTRDESVQTLVKMILIRVIQLTENRKNKTRHIAIFFDEVKYVLCHILVNCFGTIRDKNAHFLASFQSLSDLEDATTSLNPAAVRNTIIDNTALKWIYRSRASETAQWVSDLSGKTNAYEALLSTSSNLLFAENKSHSRVLRPVEVPIIHTNEIQNLPYFCAVCIGSDSIGAQIGYSSIIKVQKGDISLQEATKFEIDDSGDLI